MRSKRKPLQLVACAGLWLFAAGCSGIRASHSVSPIDFLAPGSGGMLRRLLYVPPPGPPASPAPATLPDPAAPIAPVTEIPKQVASLR